MRWGCRMWWMFLGDDCIQWCTMYTDVLLYTCRWACANVFIQRFWAIRKRERDRERYEPWHGTFQLPTVLQLSWLTARTEAWFDLLYEKIGVRSGVIHPGKHIPATAGKIQLGEYGKFWKEVAENEVMFLHDGRPCAKPGHWARYLKFICCNVIQGME